MDNKEKFLSLYTRFLTSSGDKRYDSETARAEAERVANIIDCDEYMGAAESEYCQLCADDATVHKAVFYAKTDLAKETDGEPVLLPVVVPVCKRCKRNHLLVQYLPTVLCMLLISLALIITNMNSVKSSLYDAKLFVPPTMRPFFIFAVVTAVAVILCAALRKYLMQRLSEQTVFNPLKIKRMKFLESEGFIRLYKNRQFKMMFDKNAPSYITDECTSAEDDTCCCGHDHGTEENISCECCEVSDSSDIMQTDDEQNDNE